MEIQQNGNRASFWHRCTVAVYRLLHWRNKKQLIRTQATILDDLSNKRSQTVPMQIASKNPLPNKIIHTHSKINVTIIRLQLNNIHMVRMT